MKPQYIKINEDGDKYYYSDKEMTIFHRDDGPAIEYADGSKAWYLNGKLHRDDGPAIEWATGSKYWWLNGERHREDGPAVEWSDGSKSWWLNGKKLTEKTFNNLKKPSSCAGKVVEIDGKKYKLVTLS